MSELSRYTRKHAPPARHAGKATIRRILNAQVIKPHRSQFYLEQRDPQFEARMREATSRTVASAAADRRRLQMGTDQPAIALMRAIISSTALSTGTFSLTTRFIAFAHTFSLFTIVNL